MNFQWYELPFQKGDPVQLSKLERQNMNGKEGKIFDFCQEKLRYIVELHHGRRVLIKPDNLVDGVTVTTYNTPNDKSESFMVQKEIMRTENIHTIQQLREAIDSFENVFKFLPDHKTNAMVKVLHYINIEKRVNPKIYEQCREEFNMMFRTRISLAEEFDLNPRIKCSAEIGLAIQLWIENDDQVTLDTLLNYEHKHYGQLKQLGVALSRVYTVVDKPKAVAIMRRVYQVIVDELERGFDVFGQCRCPPGFFIGHHLKILRCCSVYGKADSEIAEVMAFHESQLNSNIDSDTFGGVSLLIAKASDLLNTDPEAALELLQKSQEIISNEYGEGGHGMNQVLILKVSCFIKLQDPKSARRCLEFLLKMEAQDVRNPDTRMRDHYVEKIQECKELENDPKREWNKVSFGKHALRTCSNPACEKVEEKLRQFKRCNRCKVTSYCTKKCQKAHWKGAHKKQCKDYRRQTKV